MKAKKLLVLIALFIGAVCQGSTAKAQYSFSSISLRDIAYGSVIMDGSGNLYGTTTGGGSGGTVYKIAAGTKALSTLVTFSGSNGANPEAGLLADANGNLFGTTFSGGNGYGTVFEVANNPSHTLTTLVKFANTNGANPAESLIADANGNLYGTTGHGGANNLGTVFEIANNPSHTVTTLATFNGTNGSNPWCRLVVDSSGNLYGTTYKGGANSDGTVFEIANDANHTLTTLATFNGPNGNEPYGGLLMDGSGNLFGTTSIGGDLTQFSGNGAGTVFEIANDPSHTFSTLAIFNSSSQGYNLEGDLVMDSFGDLFGTASDGGPSHAGSVFEVANDTNHTISTLFAFDGTNGHAPKSGLLMDASGNLYGTTAAGNLYELSPVPEPSTLLLGALAAIGVIVSRAYRKRW